MLNLVYPPDWLEGRAINLNNVCSVSYRPDGVETYYNGLDLDTRSVLARITFHFNNTTTVWQAKDKNQSDKVEELYNSWNSSNTIQ